MEHDNVHLDLHHPSWRVDPWFSTSQSMRARFSAQGHMREAAIAWVVGVASETLFRSNLD